jgi:hypothetical protein
MGNNTQDRNTPRRTGEFLEPPVAADTVIYAGSLVALDGGYAVPATASTGISVIGVSDERADNAGGADGAINVKVRRGLFRFANSTSGDLITLSDVGADCYVVYDNQVGKTDGSGARPAAGKIVDVDSLGVWVEVNGREAAVGGG